MPRPIPAFSDAPSPGSSASSGAPGSAGTARVDVIVTVHDSLADVQRCLASLLAAGNEPAWRLLLVNDGSGAETTAWLRRFAAERSERSERGQRDERSEIELIEHEAALGYTRAANAGLRASRAPYVVLLNSDTVTPRGWLAGLLRCAESAPELGLVGPLSNAASWQSVPELTDERGQFAVNRLPAGVAPEAMAALVARLSPRRYPRTPFLNGFCLLIRRAVLDAIGLLDEARFPVGYGEENDYALRAAAAGFELAIADDVYVHHAKSRSFGHQRRRELGRAGTAALHAQHGRAAVEARLAAARALPLDELRAALGRELERRRQLAPAPSPLRVLFLLPVKGGGGGAHSVVQEASALRRLGVEARVAIRPRDAAEMIRLYADLPGADALFVGVHPGNLLAIAARYDVCVATAYVAVDLLARVARAFPRLLPAYYVQDYEPYFFAPGSPEAARARASYTRVPGALAFAKTDWLVGEVGRHHGVAVRRVSASLDHDVFHPPPTPRAAGGRLRVAAMIRPKTPRRGAERTLRVLRALHARHPGQLELCLFGAQRLTLDFPARNLGLLDRRQVAGLLRESELFVDLSDYQAFGRTALEAMACGCAVVVPRAGGSDEYARDGHNALVVDSTNEAACLARLSELVTDRERLARLQHEGLRTAARYTLDRAARSELELFARELATHRAALTAASPAPKTATHPAPADDEPRRALYLLPERDAHGRVTDAGYTRLVLPWQAPSLWGSYCPLVVGRGALPPPEPASLAILQASALTHDAARLLPWVEALQAAGGRLLVELGARAPAEATPPPDEPLVRWLVSRADALLVAHEAQRQAYLPLHPAAFWVPTLLDELCFASAWPRRPPATPGAPLRLGLIAPRQRDAHTQSLERALRRLRAERGAGMTVELHDPGQGLPLAGLPLRAQGESRYPERAERLAAELDWDLTLVLPGRAEADEAVQRTLEAAALGIPLLAAALPELTALARDGETALLCPPDAEAWRRALDRLLDEPELRASLAARAHAELCAEHTVGARAPLFPALLAEILALPARRDAAPAPLPSPLTIAPRPRALARAARPSLLQRLRRALLAPGPGRPRGSLRRKLDKLARDPRAFFADSRALPLRLLGALLFPHPPRPHRLREEDSGEI